MAERKISKANAEARYRRVKADERKFTKAQAHYDLGTPNRRCGLCSMYVKGHHVGDDGTCTSVEGPISPHGVCWLFERKK